VRRVGRFGFGRRPGKPTAANIVTLALSLYSLILVALPLTWRRGLVTAAVLAGFVALFPLAFVRQFYALGLLHGMLGVSLLSGAIGVTLLTLLWVVLNRYETRAPVDLSPSRCLRPARSTRHRSRRSLPGHQPGS
jgi:hypothetical protein